MTDAITSGYRSQLLAQRTLTGQAVGAGLAQVDLDLAPTRLNAALISFAEAAAGLTQSGQALAAQLSWAYLAAWLSAAAVRSPLPRVDLAARVGSVPTGVPGDSLEDAMHRAAIGLLWRLRSAPRSTAVRYGQYAAVRVAWTGLQDNATGVLDDLIREHPRIVGWRRITSPTACERCVLAAQRSYKQTEPLRRRHPSCRCTQQALLSSN